MRSDRPRDVDRAIKRFEEQTNRKAEVAACAPGRVNLIGEHVDYNDGWVLPMAIDQSVTMVGARDDERWATISSALLNETIRFDLNSPMTDAPGGWDVYVRGVFELFQRDLGCRVPAFTAVIDSDIPIGAGLSSSAALEVACATFAETLTGQTLDPIRKALLCQQVDHQFVGVPCGLMDQCASVMAKRDHLLLMDCMTSDVRHIPFPSDDLDVFIVDTRVSHSHKDGEYAKRREQCEEALRVLKRESYRDLTLEALEEERSKLDDVSYQRARHVVTENARTLAFVEALENRDWKSLGPLLYASHRSLADDYDVSCPELDFVVATLESLGADAGILGARMTGGGFGGCVVALVDRDAGDSFAAPLKRRFAETFGVEPLVYTSAPAAGCSGFLC